MNTKIKFGFYTLSVILFQSVLKLIGVLLTDSLSFLSETVDTFVDIGFIALTIYFLYQAEQPADFDHMFGHAKIDSIGALIQGIVIIIIYGLLIYNAIRVLISGVIEINNAEAGIFLLVISFVVNVSYSRILISQGKKRKSLSLEIQGLNLFQDSLRALLVMFDFVLTFFGIVIFDPIISIIISIWIIRGASKLSKEGVDNLMDVNPINRYVMEEFRSKIFDIKYVNGVEELKLRSDNDKLFIDLILSVEDHISIARANEIPNEVKSLAKKLAPNYDIEMIIEMNPLGSETSYKENLMNIIYSTIPEYPQIMEFKDFNLLSLEEKLFLSFTILMNPELSLQQAHDISTQFENRIKEQAPQVTRIITHIEPLTTYKKLGEEKISLGLNGEQTKEQLQKKIEEVLKQNAFVKGYHGLEFWKSFDYYILEIHVFFEGTLDISKVHEIVTQLEQDIKNELKLEEFIEIIIHSEPFIGRTNGVFLKTENK